jgi:hypothetical protein
VTHHFFDFHERFNYWVEDDDPPADFKFWVMAWLFALQDDPTTHAAHTPELGDKWWFARIPNAEDEQRCVVCLYSIEGDVVRCSGFTTLNKPVI